MKLIFIRHGETDVNVTGKTHFTGDSSRLTKKGIQQITLTIPVLSKNKIERVYCSPEKRAEQSARIIVDGLHLSLEILDGLKERNWGNGNGKPWNEIKDKLDKMSLEERYNFIPPQGESWKQMEERLCGALGKIISAKNKCVCVVTHAGSLRGMIPILKRLNSTIL